MISEAAHWSGLIPGAVLLYALARGRRVPEGAWWIAAGLTVSVVADAVQGVTGGGFGVTHWYLPVQMSLVLWGLTERATARAAVVLGVLLLGLFSASYSPGADGLVTAGGSLAIMTLAVYRDRFVWTLLTYFGLGSAAYLWMLPLVGTEALFDRWLVYQACRWLAFGFFAWTVLQEDPWSR